MAVFGIEKVETKVIEGYSGKYSVGRDGTVWRNGSKLTTYNGLVSLSAGGRVDRVRVAYLVARAFLKNSEGRPYVRHKNRDFRDNRVENLEWSEMREELRGRRGVHAPVVVWKKNGAFVGSWPSVEEASAALGVPVAYIRRVLNGDAESSRGYVFKL